MLATRFTELVGCPLPIQSAPMGGVATAPELPAAVSTGGGCSGFQYALALDEKREDDHVFEASGIRVLVDPASMQYVDGSTVDFTESFMGSGFEVSNPNVVASCGCGSSFRVAEEAPSCGATV